MRVVGVVVTGASGHVGVNLLRELRLQGRRVTAVDQHPPADVAGDGIDWVAADVRDRAAMRRVLDGAQTVFHLAAVISVVGDRGGLVPSVNVGGVEATARAALDVGVGRFVHCSSVHAYDLEACRGSRVDEGSPRATRPGLPAYDRSKAAGEAALRRVVEDGLDAVVVNPSGIIGPRDEAPSRMGTVLLAAARGRLPATVAGSFDWVDVRDVVGSMMAAENRGTRGENYLLGGHPASLDQLVRLVCQSTGRRTPIVDLPLWFARIWSPVAGALARRYENPLLYAGESLHALAARPDVDHSRATRELGHRPRPLAATVADLMQDFRERGMLGGVEVP